MATMHELVRANKRNTWMLIVVFVTLLLALGGITGAATGGSDYALSGIIGAVVAGVVAFFMVLFAFLGGDAMILRMSGARRIAHADEPRLFNVVEEMSIAAGTPMPKVYLIDDSAPNAFATGRDPQHASVAITTGLMEKLNRDELQGVMAHEMSHVRNFDIRFAMLMAVLVGTVAMIADMFFRRLWWGGGRRRRSGGGRNEGAVQLVLLLVAILFAIVAPIFATIIQLAVSRQRELLADASAAELTRLPEGLANALEKLQADSEPLEVANRATQHLYIVNPVMKLKGRKGSSIWSTHPPIDERIARLRAMK
jgi:heat shock protein HtpX